MGFKKLIALLFAASFMLVVAVRLNIEQMYLMSGVLVAIPAVSLALGWWALRKLDLEQVAPHYCFEGETASITLALRNAGTLSRGLLDLKTLVPPWVVTRRVTPAPNEQQGVVQTVQARRRGVYLLGPAQVTARDPLGVFTFRRRLPVHSELVVYPLPQAVPGLLPQPAGLPGAEGDQATQTKGSGLELHATREYRPGDDLRRIHWPSTARANRLVVVDRQEDADVTVLLALEVRKGTELGQGRETTLDISARIAAWMASELLNRGQSVGLLTDGSEGGGFVAPARGMTQYYQILGGLARAQASSPTSLADSLAGQRQRLGRPGNLVFFTAAPEEALLRQLDTWVRDGGSATGLVYSERWHRDHESPMSPAFFAAQAADLGVTVQLVSPPAHASAPARPGA